MFVLYFLLLLCCEVLYSKLRNSHLNMHNAMSMQVCPTQQPGEERKALRLSADLLPFESVHSVSGAESLRKAADLGSCNWYHTLILFAEIADLNASRNFPDPDTV